LPAAVAELTKSLDRMPDETLCMAAMRFVYAKPFLSTAIAGMFEAQLLDDNYKALERYSEGKPAETAALDAAREFSCARGAEWLPRQYRWLEQQWRG
jgi:aryl-alcohol dehydrogenase-like predicted oxidoreductase